MLTLILLPILYQRFGESRAERDAGALGAATGEAA
jgi:cobalt-zinc-cadmium resistance protein CzcA